MSEEQRIAVCKTSVDQIYTMLRTSPQTWRNYLTLARSVIAHIDNTSFMQQPRRTAEQSWLIGGLQRLALIDNGNAEVPDISNWCTRQWATVLQREPQNVEALRGLGSAWLSRAQPALLRIHYVDGSSSSSGGSSQWCAPSINSIDDERQAALAVREAERRSGTADYVEAKGFLQPATEYFERAIAAATAQRVLSGDLLATVCSPDPDGCLGTVLIENARQRKRTCRSATHRVLVQASDSFDERCNCYAPRLRFRATL